MKKILLVDDEPHVIHVIKLFLIKNNFEVITANNGKAALELVASNNPDVIITDIQMPIMNGQEFCEKINSEYPDDKRKIIIMTSRTDESLRVWANKNEDIDFIEKPLSPRRLVAKIRTYFHDETDSDEKLAS
jgi:DNA-binding response OmpR family regulator